jgi:hypothetical protein
MSPDPAANDPLPTGSTTAWNRRENLIAQFEQAWQRGDRPAIENFLPPGPPERDILLAELVHTELECRLKNGEAARVEDYLRRYPELERNRDLVLDLIATEYRLRRRQETALTPAEFLARFPAYASDLPGRLHSAHPPEPRQSGLPGMPTLPAPSDSARPVIPGYEILGELGRGGMGVVYKARHLELERLVALKMVLAGGHASPTELARFRSEAKAVASLQHPHIVQIHEIGEAEGRPFFSLELVEGGSLADRLDGTPWPGRKAAALVETLARAVQAAHERGIIHRDLKPANVLLTADGQPKVTDFGLAKHLEGEQGQTQSGAILGTPSYMAPEQAAGKSKDIGPATDVYALGAVLYELLTGRPPFRAETPLDTLRQVVGEEPLPPSRLNAKVPRDLETICLKALAKAPGRRYATARELAEDLGHFLKGEPIRARPVGRWEKTVRWVRRNPAVAGLLAAVVLVLLGGTGVALYFAFDAAEHAKQASVNEAKAKKNEAKALQNAADLGKANMQLERSRNHLEKTLARSLMRPLGLKAGEVLTDPEIEALWELATSQEEHLRYRFMEEALRGPVTTRQLKNRAEAALHAAVGLHGKLRLQVEQLLVKCLHHGSLTEKQQTEVAVAAAGLGGLTPKAAGCISSALTQAMAKITNDSYALGIFAKGLVAVAARLEPKDAAQAATTLEQILAKTTDPDDLRSLAQSLAAVAARLEPKDAAALCSKAGTALAQALAKPTILYTGSRLAPGLAALATRLEPRDAATILVQAMAQTTDYYAFGILAERLAAMAGRLEPKDAAAVCGNAATTLAKALVKRTDWDDAPTDLLRGLEAVAARLDPQGAAQTATTFTQAMAKTTQPATIPSTLDYLAEGLKAVATRLEAKDAAQAATALTQALAKRIGPDARRSLRQGLVSLGQGLVAVAPRLEPKDAAGIATNLVQALPKTTNPWALAQALAALTARLEAKDAAALCNKAANTLARKLANTTNPNDLIHLAQGLGVVVACLEPKHAAGFCGKAATALTHTLAKTTDPKDLPGLAKGLAAAAARLDANDAAAVCGKVATRLAQALAKTEDINAQSRLAEGLAALAARLEPQDATAVCTKAATALGHALPKTSNDSYALGILANGLAAVAAYLEPKEANGLCVKTATALAHALPEQINPAMPASLAERLVAVAARLEPKDAATILVYALDKTNDRDAVSRLAEGLRVVLMRINPREQSRRAAAAALVVSLAGTGPPVRALPLIVPALEPMPFRFSTKKLVDLLKQPTCFGKARRVILDQLENRYRQKFTDHWDFVRFAEKQKLGLDFKSPPKRPAMAVVAAHK